MTSGLPPVANICALYAAAPTACEETARDMASAGTFDRVYQPIPGWVVGARSVPSSEPVDLGGRPSLVCAEGIGQLRSLHPDPLESLAQVSALVKDAPSTLARIPGDFTFLQLGARGEATAVRSCSGRVPLFLYVDRERCAIASRLDYLVRYLPRDFELDPLANGVWLSGFRLVVDQRSLLADIQVLQAGHFARLVLGEPVRSVRYWDPRPARSPSWSRAREREHAEELRQKLLAELNTQLSTAGTNVVFMSGGVDSTALTYLAAGKLDRRVATITLLAPDPANLARQRSYVQPAQRDLALERSFEFTADQAGLLRLAREAPDTVFQVEPAINTLALCIAELSTSASTMVTGMFADEVTGSSRLLPDWLASTGAWTVLRQWRNVPVGRRVSLLWWEHRLRRLLRRPKEAWPAHLPEFVRPDVDREYQAWRHERRRRLATDEHPLPMLFALMERNGWLMDFWEGATTRDVRPVTPFYTRALLELAFQCHPREQFESQTKKLLRMGLARDVPARSLQRPDKGGWGKPEHDAIVWQDRWPSELGTVLGPDWMHGRRRVFNTIDAASLIVVTLALEALKRRRQERHSACARHQSQVRLR